MCSASQNLTSVLAGDSGKVLTSTANFSGYIVNGASNFGQVAPSWLAMFVQRVTFAAMKTRIIRIGNSQGIVLSKSLLQQYNFSNEVEIEAQAGGVFLRPVAQTARQGWDARFRAATLAGEEPEEALLEFSNDFDEIEWEWK